MSIVLHKCFPYLFITSWLWGLFIRSKDCKRMAPCTFGSRGSSVVSRWPFLLCVSLTCPSFICDCTDTTDDRYCCENGYLIVFLVNKTWTHRQRFQNHDAMYEWITILFRHQIKRGAHRLRWQKSEHSTKAISRASLLRLSLSHDYQVWLLCLSWHAKHLSSMILH